MRKFWLILLSTGFIISSCDDSSENDSSRRTFSWSASIDSLLHDTTTINFYADTLRRAVLQAKNDSVAINRLIDFAQNVGGAKGVRIAEEAMGKSILVKNEYGEINALARIGNLKSSPQNYPEADSILKLALNRANEKGFTRLSAMALSFLAENFRLRYDFSSAEHYYLQAIDSAKKN